MTKLRPAARPPACMYDEKNVEKRRRGEEKRRLLRPAEMTAAPPTHERDIPGFGGKEEKEGKKMTTVNA